MEYRRRNYRNLQVALPLADAELAAAEEQPVADHQNLALHPGCLVNPTSASHWQLSQWYTLSLIHI